MELSETSLEELACQILSRPEIVLKPTHIIVHPRWYRYIEIRVHFKDKRRRREQRNARAK